MPTTKSSARIGEGGRIVIPAEIRKELDFNVGDKVMLRVVDGELRVCTVAQAIRRAQEIARTHIPPGRSLVDELIAERRAEAARE